MSEEIKQEGGSTQTSAWEKFRGFVKSNKNKIIAVFAAIEKGKSETASGVMIRAASKALTSRLVDSKLMGN